MARRLRLDGASVAHHVMVRGIEGAPIFGDVDDRHDFVDRACRILPECGARCFGWVVMSNHAHMIVQTAAGTLSRVMQRLNTGFAVRFNRLRERRGYLFMDRFRSRIVESDADLIGLIRYVHANPLEAGLVASLDALGSYPWSGHGALVGARDPFPFEAVAAALSLFDDDPDRARAELLAWMARDAAAPAAEARERPLPSVTAPAARFEPRGGLAGLLRAVTEHYRLAPGQLGSGRKIPRVVRARSVAAYFAVLELGEPARAVARALGVSQAAISAALERGRRAALEDGFWLAREDVPNRGI
jgi:REP element-mobilizing transposase RayT